MSTHTKGPWRTVETSWDRATIWSAEDALLAEVCIDSSVDEDSQDHLESEMNANARIMAASPDLLEEAKSTDQGYDWFLSQLTDFRLYQGSWSLENGDNWAASLVAHIKSRQIGTKAVIVKAEGL